MKHQRKCAGHARRVSATRPFSVALAAALLCVACGEKNQGGAPPPLQVGVIQAQPQAVPITRELVGRLSATRAADVRARVAGVLLKRLYQEGSDVKEGQPLFQIDPAPLQAEFQAAEAALAQAEANATNAKIAAQRHRDLVATGSVSRSELDNAEANERSTAAQVQQAKANAQVARINLGYATVRSPIAGRAGQQRVTEGALVGENEPTLLTIVEQIDPIYVNFDQSVSEVQRLMRGQATGAVTLRPANQADVQLVLSDGTAYGSPGTLEFSAVSADPATGSLAYRGVIPNPDRQLLPGTFVGLSVTLGELNNGFLVPQAALLRDSTGPYVQVVGTDEKVQQKRVAAESMLGGNWVVTQGLAAGDRIIVTGLQQAQPGMQVKAVAQEPATRQAKPEGGAAEGGPPVGQQ